MPRENLKNEKEKRVKVCPKSWEKKQRERCFKTLNQDGTFKELKKDQDEAVFF